MIFNIAFVAGVAGCSAAPSEPTGGGALVDAGLPDGAVAANEAAPGTWTALYAGYFGPGTPGHCGNAGCHALSQSGFQCGPSAASCYAGLVAANLVNPSTPTTSAIADPNQSPLAWFGGNMPRDNALANTQAAAAVSHWVMLGAPND